MKLSEINSPKDIRGMDYKALENLADEIREKIITTVHESGGHLASNLGVVELTLALHRVFDTPNDKIIFDVGHQTYTHKLITGRYKNFNTLRTHNGLSGFPRYSESEYDNFEVGHASTAISAALGMARSRDLKNENHNVVAVVGDGALTGGMCYEALNDAGLANTRLIVILNDNEMSISKNVGALSTYLSKIRTSSGYRFAKDTVRKGALNIPIIGPLFHSVLHFFKSIFKYLLVRENFFAPLGFHYLGPIDGHDIKAVESILGKAKTFKAPVLIHCCTKKGLGYKKAEAKPEKYHGVSPKKNDTSKEIKQPIDSGKIASLTLLKEMEENKRIVVITAAMSTGTSTCLIKEKYPERYFDVGIAEEHALTMCAGLAKTGMKPYFFVYSTFFQRCIDQMIHDVYLQNLPVTLMLDRSGLSGQDGVTHHGIYDISLLNTMSDVKIFAPANNNELEQIVHYSTNINKP
ncbi:MAG: 1-deoxy-D-xylulose-5-phosphate synthase, partial [Christensenellaceae bacterium]|nr:1-deoxy-D-xylulose-5-phosphate synthase [Christensenellaceae bacterium]